jgi:hypothetical protein
MGGGKRVGDDESGGWLVMERKLLLESVLCKRWVGVGGDESGGWKVMERNVLWKKCCVRDGWGLEGLRMMRMVVERNVLVGRSVVLWIKGG